MLKKIQTCHKSKVIKERRVPITKQDQKISKKSLINYRAMLACTKGISISTTVVSKMTTRYIAENSLMSAMALICVVASTHYYVYDEGQLELRRNIFLNPDGVRMFHNMTANVHDNLSIFPVRPELLFYANDTVNYICEGKGEKNTFCLVVTKSLKRLVEDQSKNMTIQKTYVA